MDEWDGLLLKKKLLLKRKILLLNRKRKREANQNRWWVRPVWRNRKNESEFFTAMKKLRNSGDMGYYIKYFRMTPRDFGRLLAFVEDDLKKEHLCRQPISPMERLALTLRYLSSGMEIKDVAMAYRVGLETAREAILLTCAALWERLKDVYMRPPSTAEWQAIAKGFERRWQFPNCLGAVDGKHVKIIAPKKSGSAFFNYKGTYSIVLMAVVDFEYKFRLIDVGAEGRLSDSGVFKSSPIGVHLENGTLGIPGLAQLAGTELVAPHVFIGDEAFQLRPDFLRPYPGKNLPLEKSVYNYRLSRARNCVENAFGILAARWRILLQTVNLMPKNVDIIVRAACVLHNFLMAHGDDSHDYGDSEDSFGNVIEGRWHEQLEGSCLQSLQGTHARNHSSEAAASREAFTKYFVSPEGAVPWQWSRASAPRPAKD